MEHQKDSLGMLELISQPAFLVNDNRILRVNAPARTLLLSADMEVTPLLMTGQDEYAAFQDGQLYLTLSIGEMVHSASVLRLPEGDLFLLDSDSEPELFRSMGLLSMQLRQPLALVMNSVGALYRDMENRTESDNANFAKMNRSLMQLMRIINNLSDIERYSQSSHKQMRNICAIVEELVEKSRALTEESGIRIRCNVPLQPIFCLADSEQMERAIWNLLSNAIKFTPPDGEVLVSLTRQGQKLRLTVTDSGSGIAQSVRTSLFQRYLRRPGIEDSRFGMGLGMAIIRVTAANHGGTVLVDQPGGKGTRITMTLSLQQDCSKLMSPILLPDYAGGWDHGLLELADCLPPEAFGKIL